MVDFVMGRKQAISKTEDAVLKVRYQGTEKNFKFLFSLLCCASRKSPFFPPILSFLPILSVFLVTSSFIVWCVSLLTHKLQVAHWIFAVKKEPYEERAEIEVTSFDSADVIRVGWQ